MNIDINQTLNDISRLSDEYERNLEVAVSLESMADSLDFESFESTDFEALGFLINSTLESRGFSLDVLSQEVDSPTLASDTAIGKETETKAESKADKFKEGLKETAKKFLEKAKEIAKDIKPYLLKLQEVLTNSTSALKNSVTAIENKLQTAEPTPGKINGNFSIFSKAKPSGIVAMVSNSGTGLSNNIKPIFDDFIKKSKGDSTGTTVTLSMKDHAGSEFKYDGTGKFFKPNMSFEKAEISSLTKTDIEATCREVTKLVAILDSISGKAKELASTNFDSMVTEVKDGDGKIKSSMKELMSISSFNKNVIGGFVKYAIKISQTSLDACNKSITKKEDSKNE